MNDVLIQFVIFFGLAGMVLGGFGLFAGHQWRKYQALNEAHREAEREAQYGVTLPIPDIPQQLG